MHDTTHSAATKFWDREAISPTHVSWMGHPLVRAYINESISGSPHTWPVDWLVEWLGGRRFQRALSIGCGAGPLERDLIRKGLCGFIDAFDGSPQSIQLARDLAAEEGVGDRVHYYVDDFNGPRLPRRTYDAVFFHQSAHHVGKLEKLFSAVLRALRPNGIVYLDEYIGPSRFDWTDELIAVHRQYFATIPADARAQHALPLPIHPDDPSEALRSSEIIPQLEHGFRILQRRDYGGSLLSVLFPTIKWDSAPQTLTAEMITAERELLRQGLPPYHAIIVAAPKRARWYARMRYYIAPKLRRIRWEIRKRRWPDRNLPF